MKLHWRIWFLIFILILSLLFIAPWKSLDKGVMIQSVDKDSEEFSAGLRAGMIITEINGFAISNLEDYSYFISNLSLDNSQEKIVIVTKESEFIFIKNNNLTITVSETPNSNIKTGLDLQGGARALIKPANITLTQDELNDLITITNQRFNVYGLKDIAIKPVTDLQGNTYMLIEIAGATPEDLEDLIASQGLFEGRIGNITVFSGDKGDISHVERSGQQSGIEGCYDSQDGSKFCRFRFAISLTEKAAQQQAAVTKNLSLDSENPEYLSQKIDLYLDGNLVDSLYISKDLQGRVLTEISIQGSGTGSSSEEALENAQESMKKLQTILITGSLPYKLEIVKLDTLSPALGKSFAKNLILLAILVFFIISLLLFIRYRKIKITLAVILTMFSEAFITLAIAALIKWNLDAPSIAGIIAGMGTGVDDQIIILDESISTVQISLKEKIKRAFFIIFGAFSTLVAAMLPLLWAGAGTLKGFAITTLIGVTAGILITRPAFAEIIKKIQE